MSEIVGQRMSDYPKLENLTPAEQETYLANAAVTTYGKTSNDGTNTNVNVPLSAIKPDVPVTDVTVGGTSVVSNGVAEVPEIPTAESLADDGLREVNGKLEVDHDTSLTIVTVGYLSENRRQLSVANPVPSAGGKAGQFLTVQRDPDSQIDEIVWDTIPSELPEIGTSQHRGEYLKVADDSDSLVWDSPAVPEISQYNGDVSVINATNDVSSGGYVFDVNLDSDTLEKRSTEGANQVSYIAVKNPVPPTTDASDGDVLTYDASDGIVWAAPQGGGGGGDIVILELTVQLISDSWHLTAASLTPQQIVSNVLDGKLVVARVIKTYNNVTTNIIEVQFGEYYDGSPYGDGYALWFSPFGSGGGGSEHNVWIGTMRGGTLQWSSDLWEVSDIDES